MIAPHSRSATVRLLESGCTVPFIARYRTSETGGLTPEEIRAVRLEWLRVQAVDARRAAIVKKLGAVAAGTPLTARLRRRLDAARTLHALEELYAPFKTKRRTRAAVAIERGVEPLCRAVWDGRLPPHAAAPRGLATWAARLAGGAREEGIALATDLLASYVATEPAVVRAARAVCEREAKLRARPKKAKTAKTKKAKASVRGNGERAGGDAATFRGYFEFHEPVRRCRPHQILALNRGAALGALSVALTMPSAETGEATVRAATARARNVRERGDAAALMRAAEAAAWTRLIKPSLSRALRKASTARAHAHAVGVFARNVRSALLAPPLPRRRVLGVDPAFRSGCKLAAVDERGVVLRTAVVHPHDGSAATRARANELTARLARELRLEVAAIGNGTACRETEKWLAELIGSGAMPPRFAYTIVSEAGASVYSASPAAHLEFPSRTPSEIGAISIARRLQDPLLELVKVAPVSLGVGLYQHDLPAADLRYALEGAVQDAVALVGVDVNSASEALLSLVPGLTATTAKALYARVQSDPLEKRAELTSIAGIGPKAYEQCAGFLRVVSAGADPLDGTCIHPETYSIARVLLARAGVDAALVLAPSGSADAMLRRERLDRIEITPALARRILVGDGEAAEAVIDLTCEPNASGGGESALRTIGEAGVRDVLAWLKRGAQFEPRQTRSESVFRRDVVTFPQLRVGMEVSGVVRNVVDFGAFVDIGLKSDGMLHITAMRRRGRARPDGAAAAAATSSGSVDPYSVVSVGMVLELFVISLDAQRRRVGLGLDPPRKGDGEEGSVGGVQAASASSSSRRPAERESKPKPKRKQKRKREADDGGDRVRSRGRGRSGRAPGGGSGRGRGRGWGRGRGRGSSSSSRRRGTSRGGGRARGSSSNRGRSVSAAGGSRRGGCGGARGSRR